MPELDNSNAAKAKFTRFVRAGKTIYFTDSGQLHIDLKHEYLPDKSVDDAGFLRPDDNGRLTAEGGSTSLGISKLNPGRAETDKILSDLPPLN